MGPFLQGFAEELIKVSAPGGFQGPSWKPLASIKPQVMQSPPKAKRELYRPSPKYTPKPTAAATATAAPAGRGRRARQRQRPGRGPYPGTLKMLGELAHGSEFRGKQAIKKMTPAQRAALPTTSYERMQRQLAKATPDPVTPRRPVRRAPAEPALGTRPVVPKPASSVTTAPRARAPGTPGSRLPSGAGGRAY